MQPLQRPLPPFPQRLKKSKEVECFQKFFHIFKEFHINLSLIDILQGMPKYAKYLKDVVVNKMRLMDVQIVALTEECSFR